MSHIIVQDEDKALNSKACPFKFDKEKGNDLCLGLFCMAWIAETSYTTGGFCGRVHSNTYIADALNNISDSLDSVAVSIRQGLDGLSFPDVSTEIMGVGQAIETLAANIKFK